MSERSVHLIRRDTRFWARRDRVRRRNNLPEGIPFRLLPAPNGRTTGFHLIQNLMAPFDQDRNWNGVAYMRTPNVGPLRGVMGTVETLLGMPDPEADPVRAATLIYKWGSQDSEPESSELTESSDSDSR